MNMSIMSEINTERCYIKYVISDNLFMKSGESYKQPDDSEQALC